MNEELQTLLQSKLTAPQEAVKCVKSGDTVYIGTCTSTAYALCEALGERQDELENVHIACSNILKPLRIMNGERNFSVLTYFMGAQERRALAAGHGDFTSFHLSQVDIWCREIARPDVAFLEVSPPDENGYMSFGASGVALHRYIQEASRTVILQINRHAPYVYGEHNLIHISQADAIVCVDEPLVENPSLPFDETIQTISDFLLEQIPDGACIQLGLGGVANAVGEGLKTKNDLGAHSELMTESMMRLMQLGVLNNSRKEYMKGVTVAGFAFGPEALYRFLDHNKNVYFMPFPQVNNPINIAKNSNMISVNTALTIDLMGQVVADNLNGRQFSGTGGQLDFVRGAQLSPGGKSFIAVTSTVNSKTGTLSRIVPQIPAGSAITTPRSEVQYVVTEFGCVNLKPLSMKDRVRAMISLAHPDFRPQLTDDAKHSGLL